MSRIYVREIRLDFATVRQYNGATFKTNFYYGV